ncbi:MAG: MmpS family transport accessory protein [Actinomycetia bacterium]|nr:MmpS family transport accessory protein [Actinomycetes bacterium]
MRSNWMRSVIVVASFMILVSACSSDSSSSDVDTNAIYEVVYQIVAPDMTSTEITYTHNGGNDIFRGVVDLPFKETFQMNLGDIIDLGAKTDGSTATCRILIDGVKYRESTETNGNFPVCQGIVEPAE